MKTSALQEKLDAIESQTWDSAEGKRDAILKAIGADTETALDEKVKVIRGLGLAPEEEDNAILRVVGGGKTALQEKLDAINSEHVAPEDADDNTTAEIEAARKASVLEALGADTQSTLDEKMKIIDEDLKLKGKERDRAVLEVIGGTPSGSSSGVAPANLNVIDASTTVGNMVLRSIPVAGTDMTAKQQAVFKVNIVSAYQNDRTDMQSDDPDIRTAGIQYANTRAVMRRQAETGLSAESLRLFRGAKKVVLRSI